MRCGPSASRPTQWSRGWSYTRRGFAGSQQLAQQIGQGTAIIFAGNYPGRTQTMPLAIYIGFEMEFDVALTLALILLMVSFTVLFV
ncbi:MAG: hypothetical protein H7Y32_20485, partial [Chloroflexales bacterium]|nr:hypothetical protein [Chloroflexales bacterium]